MSPPSVILLGYRGSGKTTLGRLLAEKLRYTFLDTDHLITSRAGKTIAQIFADDGEVAFRDLEEQAVADAIAQPQTVVSLGGGAVLRPSTRDRLLAAASPRIYLACPAATLAHRLSLDPATAHARPALTSAKTPFEEVTTLLAAREPLYRQVATHTLDVTPPVETLLPQLITLLSCR